MTSFTFGSSLLLCASALFAQQVTSVRTGVIGGAAGGSAHFSVAAPPFLPANSITGAPYSAEQVSEHVQTLADGTHITRKNAVQKMFRDSLGRTRNERPIGPIVEADPLAQNRPLLVEITDPVAHVRYTLDTVNKIAHRTQLPNPPQPAIRQAAANAAPQTRPAAGILAGGPGPGAIQSARVSSGAGVIGQTVSIASPGTNASPALPRAEMTTETLGQNTIEGVLVEGRRTTMTYKVDSIGNDRPISVVTETWTAPNLKVTVLAKTDDPRSGVNTTKLVNVSQSEPPADLFQPPADYKIVDETGGFDIQWGNQLVR